MLHGAKGELTEIYSRVSQLMNGVAQQKRKDPQKQTAFVQGIQGILGLACMQQSNLYLEYIIAMNNKVYICCD